MENSYVILPSNVKSDEYPNNKISHYYTPLPKAIQLNAQNWEVALTEISYPHTWNNIISPYNKIVIEKNDIFKGIIRDEIYLTEGYYSSATDIKRAFDEKKLKIFRGGLDIQKYSRKVKIILFNGETITLHPVMAKLLGFDKDTFTNEYESPPGRSLDPSDMPKEKKKLVTIAPYTCDLNAAMTSIYIYSNVCRDLMVGNKFAPLLRTVKVEGQDGDYIQTSFDTPHYVPVAHDTLNVLEIKLAWDTGHVIRFEYGKVIVKLHFRKKNHIF